MALVNLPSQRYPCTTRRSILSDHHGVAVVVARIILLVHPPNRLSFGPPLKLAGVHSNDLLLHTKRANSDPTSVLVNISIPVVLGTLGRPMAQATAITPLGSRAICGPRHGKTHDCRALVYLACETRFNSGYIPGLTRTVLNTLLVDFDARNLSRRVGLQPGGARGST